MDAPPASPFSGSPLIRGRPPGADEGWYEAARADPRARFVPYHTLKVLLKDSAPVWLARAALPEGVSAVFLGRHGATPFFAADVSALGEAQFEPFGQFVELRAAAMLVPAPDLALLGHGRALIDWHARHGFCARCGQATQIAEGGAKRVCASCAAQHFPRTDPVVIMLASRGDMTLLGRQERMPPGLYTALAGFVDQGETIEEAVAREIFEEAGIRIANVRYFASQPWPFPSSLMIGCFADAVSEAIAVDKVELEDARWFSRDEVRALLANPFGGDQPFAPPPFSIAHRLMRRWALSA